MESKQNSIDISTIEKEGSVEDILTKRQIRGLNVGCGSAFYHLYPDNSPFLYTDIEQLTDAQGQSSSADKLVLINHTNIYLQHDATLEFPLPDHSFEWIFCEHFVEHLKPSQFLFLAKEFKRLLKPGGIIRLSTPDLALFTAGYEDPKQHFFSGYANRLASYVIESNVFRSRYPEQLSDEQILQETKFWRNLDPQFSLSDNCRENLLLAISKTIKQGFSRPAAMVNQIFQYYGHQWIYDWNEIVYWLTQAGFESSQLERVAYQQGKEPLLYKHDQALRSEESLFIEIYK